MLLVYQATRSFPKEELFGFTSQMRRSALSIPCNIVEGCARNTLADYIHFLDTAYGSARELQYQVHVASRLGYIKEDQEIAGLCEETCKSMNSLIRSLREKRSEG